MSDHTLHPSHSLLTEDRVFIPRTCSTCLADAFAKATALPVCACPRSLVSPFWIMCENGRNEAARVVTEGRYWRRAPEEAPKTVRRENMAVFGFGILPRKVINWRLCLKPHRMKSKRYRGAGAWLMFWLQRFSAIANVGRRFCIADRPKFAPADWWVCYYKYNEKILNRK